MAAALLGEIDVRGKLDADIAVLELDEAHAVHFVDKIPPQYSLLLNVMRDQLDRFGEIDHTAKLLQHIAQSTTDGVVVNRDDPRLSSKKFMHDIHVPRTFGVSADLRKHFPSDDTLYDKNLRDEDSPIESKNDDTSLVKIDGSKATLYYGNKEHTITLRLNGIYNTLNAVGAVALCRMIVGDKLNESRLLEALSSVTPAFGRGETITVNGKPCQLVLVKNPSGFRLGLQSFDLKGYATMIAINDNYADGRDMSWLWDVEFNRLQPHGVAAVTGVRAFDMALRLQYDDVPIGHVTTDISESLAKFVEEHPDEPKRIYCTYTAMLTLRKELTKYSKVEDYR